MIFKESNVCVRTQLPFEEFVDDDSIDNHSRLYKINFKIKLIFYNHPWIFYISYIVVHLVHWNKKLDDPTCNCVFIQNLQMSLAQTFGLLGFNLISL